MEITTGDILDILSALDVASEPPPMLGRVPPLPEDELLPDELHDALLTVCANYLPFSANENIGEAFSLTKLMTGAETLTEALSMPMSFAGGKVPRGYVYLGFITNIISDSVNNGEDVEDVGRLIGIAILALESAQPPLGMVESLRNSLAVHLRGNIQDNEARGIRWSDLEDGLD